MHTIIIKYEKKSKALEALITLAKSLTGVKVEESDIEEKESKPNKKTLAAIENVEKGKNLTITKNRKDFWNKINA